jgi:hypothetical protein
MVFQGHRLAATDYFNPADFQYNMTITGTLNISGIEIGETDTLFAYSGSECRGFISPIYEEDDATWFTYLVVYSNQSSESITFSYYNAKADMLITLTSTVIFVIDQTLGTAGDPFVFSNTFLDRADPAMPDQVTFTLKEKILSIQLEERACFEMFDMSGRLILMKELENGRSDIQLDAFPDNIYLLRFRNEQFSLTRKIYL